MQQDIITNYVLAEFYIYGKELDFKKISQIMNVSNPKTIEKDKIKVEEFSYDYWSFDTDYEQSEDINIQLNKILQHIENKCDNINYIKRIYNAECGFSIVIKNEISPLPAIYFERNMLKIVALIDAEINIDFTGTQGDGSIVLTK